MCIHCAHVKLKNMFYLFINVANLDCLRCPEIWFTSSMKQQQQNNNETWLLTHMHPLTLITKNIFVSISCITLLHTDERVEPLSFNPITFDTMCIPVWVFYNTMNQPTTIIITERNNELEEKAHVAKLHACTSRRFKKKKLTVPQHITNIGCCEWVKWDYWVCVNIICV